MGLSVIIAKNLNRGYSTHKRKVLLSVWFLCGLREMLRSVSAVSLFASKRIKGHIKHSPKGRVHLGQVSIIMRCHSNKG